MRAPRWRLTVNAVASGVCGARAADRRGAVRAARPVLQTVWRSEGRCWGRGILGRKRDRPVAQLIGHLSTVSYAWDGRLHESLKTVIFPLVVSSKIGSFLVIHTGLLPWGTTLKYSQLF